MYTLHLYQVAGGCGASGSGRDAQRSIERLRPAIG